MGDRLDGRGSPVNGGAISGALLSVTTAVLPGSLDPIQVHLPGEVLAESVDALLSLLLREKVDAAEG